MCSNSAKICVAAIASALLCPSSLGVVAFHPSSPPCTLSQRQPQVPQNNHCHTRLNISPFGGTGWDNDDFLSSLAGGGPADDAEGSTELTRSMEAAQRQLRVQERQGQGGGDAAALAAATAALGRDQSAAPGGYGAGYAQPQSRPQVQQGMGGSGSGAQVQRQEVGALPLGWSAHFDPDSQQLYYYNVNDGTTQWDRPASPPPPPLPPGASGGGGDSAMFGAGQQQSTASLPAEEARAADEAPVDETVAGAVLTPDMKAKIMASHTEDEEQSGGGHKFRDLMERAKAAAARGQPQQQRMQQQQQQQQQQQPQSVQLPPEAADLPLDVQARMYRELQWRQSNPQVESYATPQYQMNGIGIDGRKVGRNRDSDMISNDSDVYMARLKRDSTTRNLARYAGDDARANDVFHDEEGLAAIQGPEENPYLKERRERERDMVETVPEEMLLFQEYDEEQQQSGQQQQQQSVSYRDRLRQIQEERRSSQ